MPDASQRPTRPQGPEQWIDSYLNGELTADAGRAFERWLLEKPAHVERLARAVLQDTHLRAAVVSRRLESGFSMLDSASNESKENDDQLMAIDQDIMNELVDQALARRRKQEIEDAANTLLVADQAEAARDRRFELRRRAQDAKAQDKPAVIPAPLVWLGLAAVLGLVATLAIVFNQPVPSTIADPPERTSSTPEVETPASAPVALIRSSVGARWVGLADDRDHRLQNGTSLTLSEGLAEVVFEDGAAVIIQAPATFQPTGPNAMRMVSGRLTATIPASAQGFTIQTPGGLITDYGTEFGVIVNHDGQTLAQTFSGRIGLTPVGGTEVDLLAGDAVVAAPSGRVRTVEPDAMAFVRGEEYAAQHDAETSANARWLAYCYGLQRDPEVLGLFLADSVRPGQDNSVIPNLANARGRAVSISDGRFIEQANRAEDGIRLDKDGDAFTFEVDGRLDEVTLLVWAHVDPGHTRDLRTLVASDENNAAGALHWNLHFPVGQVSSRVGIRNGLSHTDNPWPTHDALFDGGQLPEGWHLYAVTLNGQDGRVRHYLDGVLLVESQMRHRGPLVLGTTRVGGWLMDPEVGEHTRILRGTVGLVAVVEGARDAAQMLTLYRHLSQTQSQGGTPPAPTDF